jgi:hypothetical protein
VNLRASTLTYKTWGLKLKEQKALDDKELTKLAKTKEAQALEANTCDLKGQLEFGRGQWIELHKKYKDFLDRFFILDYCKRVLVAKAVWKKLDDHLGEEFYKQVSMEVTKRVIDIMKYMEL